MRIPKLTFESALICVLLLTPLLNINEVLSLINGSLVHHSSQETPLYLKLTKDFGMFVLLLIVLLDSLKQRKFSCYSLFFLLVMCTLLLPFAAFALANGDIFFLAGMRWISPIVLGAAFIGKIREEHLLATARALSWLFLTSFLVQCTQLAFASNYYGLNIIGLPGRVGGFFIIPSTAAHFACIAFMFAFYFLPQKEKKRKLILFLAPFSVLLAASATGAIVMTVAMFLVVAGRFAYFLLPVPVLALVLVWLYLPQITNRPDIYVSIEERGAILTKSVKDAEIVSTRFGRSTNSGVLLSASKGENEATIADSFYIAVLSNTGFLGFALLFIATTGWSVWVFCAQRFDAICATLIWGLFAMTTQITESFPANLIMAILIGYYLGPVQRKQQQVGSFNQNIIVPQY